MRLGSLLKWLVACLLFSILAGCKGLSATSIDNLGQVLTNFAAELPAVWKMLIALSYVMGIAFTLVGLFRLKKYGQQTVMMMSAANIGEPMIYIIVGSALFYLPSMLNGMVETFWGYKTDDISSYASSVSASPNWDHVIEPVMQIIQIIGLVAFIRGFALLTRMAGQSQPGTLGKAAIHIIGGTLAVNIYGTVDIINNTLF